MRQIYVIRKTNCTFNNNFCFYSEKVAITPLFAIVEAFNQLSDYYHNVTVKIVLKRHDLSQHDLVSAWNHAEDMLAPFTADVCITPS